MHIVNPQPAGYDENEISTEEKGAAILSYIGLLGFIIAVVLQSQKKTRIGSFHMRQGLGMMISGFAMVILLFIPFLGWILMPFVGIGLFVLNIMGIVNAAQGRFKPVPLLGPLFIKMLGTTFD